MMYASYVTYLSSYLRLKFNELSIGKYVGDSKFLLVGAPTSIPATLVSKQDWAGGNFKGDF
jgi:hypothetical protein